MTTNIRFISAGAGSGKTYCLTEELAEVLTGGRARPDGVIGTTFTNKAANELRERVRQSLIEGGKIQLANKMSQALLGTVNSVCGRLLEQFAFEAGLPPNLEVLPEDDQLLFNQAVEASISVSEVHQMNDLSYRLGIEDWIKDIKDVVNKARANNMQPDDLSKFGRQNADGIMAFFPEPTSKNLWGDLSKAVEKAVSQIEANDDTTKGTQNYIILLKQYERLIKDRRLPWHMWVKLGKDSQNKLTKKSKPLAESVIQTVSQYDRHPLLHRDIRQFCENIFKLAAAALGQYQNLKKKRGLIDFVDQEQLMLNALNQPEIFQVMREELDLLLVDEFQDTSPIQLALFLKLAEAAKEAVFVGDVKQSIYGFRGSDPELMQAVLREVQNQGGITEVLKKSWRSRPSLISYTNSLFVPAFKGKISPDQVRLTPERKEETKEPAVINWVLKGKNKRLIGASLASGIHQLVEDKYKLVDPLTKKLRSIRFDDIAVLARFNDTVNELAGELATAGIPVQMERSGLLATPEACLATACLRRMADPGDTLASAEIIALSDCDTPEKWLESRLKYLESGRPGHLWGEDEDSQNPLMMSLAQQRGRLKHLTPSEAMATTIDVADLRRIVTSWGPSPWRVRQRLQNLDALANYAVEYEEHCRTQRQASTVAGLIVWLNQLSADKQDLQPRDPKSNSVHMLTHHKAKGLEWPVVIAMDLNADLKTRLWNLNVISGTDRVDLKNPLSDRYIRFWPFPFGRNKKEMPIVDRIENSKIGLSCKESAIEEDKRLLYVSLTRARDLLVIALPAKKPTGPWMDTLNAEWMLPGGDTMLLSDKTEIPTAYMEFDASESEETIAGEDYKPFWLGPRLEASDKLPAILHPSSMEKLPDANVLQSKNVGMRLEINGSPSMDQVGLALHKLITAEIINPLHPDALITAERLSKSHGIEENIAAEEAVAYVQYFLAHVTTVFKPDRILAEYPVHHMTEEGQLVKGWIDTLIEKNGSWVIIDHKFTTKPESELEKEALKYSGQLRAYREGVEAATAKKVESNWIHFPLAGILCELKI